MSELEPVPAATVVLVRQSPQEADLEVLLLQRNSRLVFHGGHWVFPGGRIDDQDFDSSGAELEYPAALRAAVRETKEEAGIEINKELPINDFKSGEKWTELMTKLKDEITKIKFSVT